MYQKHIIIGYLGKDPEMRYTPTGVPVTSFSIATSRRWTNQNGEMQEKTTWFRVTCWRKTAEFAAQYLHKGMRVLVEGEELDASTFTDREGKPRASLELTAMNIKFMQNKDEGGSMQSGATQPADAPMYEDDLPF